MGFSAVNAVLRAVPSIIKCLGVTACFFAVSVKSWLQMLLSSTLVPSLGTLAGCSVAMVERATGAE